MSKLKTLPRNLAMRDLTAAVLSAALLWPSMSAASDDCTLDAMVVFDGSGSMAEMGFNLLETPRIFEAREAMHEAIPSLADLRRLGLIIYGPGDSDVCSHIELHFEPMRQASGPILSAIDGVEPSGNTALTDAVRQAAEVLDYRSEPGAIVLVTDGKETCDGVPCALAQELRRDARNLTVHVIGFRVRGDFLGWDVTSEDDYTQAGTVARCLADQTGGKYLSTESVAELVGAMHDTLGCAVIGSLDRAGSHPFDDVFLKEDGDHDQG